jgi:hypothetical protein
MKQSTLQGCEPLRATPADPGFHPYSKKDPKAKKSHSSKAPTPPLTLFTPPIPPPTPSSAGGEGSPYSALQSFRLPPPHGIRLIPASPLPAQAYPPSVLRNPVARHQRSGSSPTHKTRPTSLRRSSSLTCDANG